MRHCTLHFDREETERKQKKDSGCSSEEATEKRGKKVGGRGRKSDLGGLHPAGAAPAGTGRRRAEGHQSELGGASFREIEYEPLPSQKRFHESAARFKGFSGPIGSGKSQALCQEAIKLSYQNPGRTGLIGAPTYPMLRDATLQSLVEVLNGNDIPFDFNKSEFVLTFRDTPRIATTL